MRKRTICEQDNHTDRMGGEVFFLFLMKGVREQRETGKGNE